MSDLTNRQLETFLSTYLNANWGITEMDNKMKSTLAIIGSATMVCIVALVVLLILSDKDPSAIFNALPGIAASLGSLLAIGIVSQKVDRVQGQTNGTLSALREENARLHADKMALLTVATPEQVAEAVTVNTQTLPVS